MPTATVDTLSTTRTVARRRRSRRLLLGVGLVTAAVALSACSSSSATPTAASTPQSSTTAAASGGVLGTASTPLGTILVDSQGRTVYLFASDTPGHSSCTGSCLQYWPIVPAPATKPAQVSGITATIGSITRPDGTKQLTVNGLPVYTYVGDTSPGMTSGQGINLSGGLWWVASPSGDAITTSTSGSQGSSPSPSPSSTTSKASGGGWA